MSEVVPRHIGIIMDGNGRWAEQRGLARIEGHQAGAEATMEAVRACAALGVKNLTVFTPPDDLPRGFPGDASSFLDLSSDALRSRLEELGSLGVRLLLMGPDEGLSPEVLRRFDEAAESTRHNDRMLLYVAFNYGGRREIFDAALRVAEEVARGEAAATEVDEDSIRRNFYDPELPDIDLLIRTGGERRLSDFMLWHCAYAELYFTDLLWPDFRAADLEEALREFHDRERKFGAITQ